MTQRDVRAEVGTQWKVLLSTPGSGTGTVTGERISVEGQESQAFHREAIWEVEALPSPTLQPERLSFGSSLLCHHLGHEQSWVIHS